MKHIKGENRPIFKYKERAKVVSGFMFVNYVFEIRINGVITEKSLEKKHEKILEVLKPNYLITNPFADKYLENRKAHARKYGAEVLLLKLKPRSSTSITIEKIYS